MHAFVARKNKSLRLLILLVSLSACSNENTKPDLPNNGLTKNINASQLNKLSVPTLSLPVKPHEQVFFKLSNSDREKFDLHYSPITVRTLPVLLKLKGQIEPDFGKQVDVGSRILGRVVKVYVHPGETVATGQLLAIVNSHEISDLEAELIEAKGKLAIAEAQKERENQIYQEQFLRPKTLIEAKSRFSAAKSHLELTDSEFRRQQSLYAEKITSQRNYTEAKIARDEAHTEFEASKLNLQREEHLYNNQALLKKDLLIADAAYEQALRHLDTLRQRLIFHGMSANNIATVLKTNQLSGSLQILAPVAGIVTHADVAVGEMVHSTDTIFRIVDLNNVFVKADLPEEDLSLAKLGSQVEVIVSSYPDHIFQGTISFIAESVNKETHTIPIRAKLSNAEHSLKTNMSAQIVLKGPEKTILACPIEAIFTHGEDDCVLVNNKSGLALRKIVTGAEGQDYIEVLSGLKKDETVVTKGLKEVLSLSP